VTCLHNPCGIQMRTTLPVYGSTRVPDGFSHHDALESFNSFFVNHFVDHHTHEFITSQ
ncbi:hypothetical protein BJV77DRAFT_944719, partial [Russula vinacea]